MAQGSGKPSCQYTFNGRRAVEPFARARSRLPARVSSQVDAAVPCQRFAEAV